METTQAELNRLKEQVRAFAEQQIALSNEITSLNASIPVLRQERDSILNSIEECKKIKQIELDRTSKELDDKKVLLDSKEKELELSLNNITKEVSLLENDKKELSLEKANLELQRKSLDEEKDYVIRKDATLDAREKNISNKEEELSNREKSIKDKEIFLDAENNRLIALGVSLENDKAKTATLIATNELITKDLDVREQKILLLETSLSNKEKELSEREIIVIEREKSIADSKSEFDSQVRTIAEANQKIALAWLKVNKAIQEKQLALDLEALKK